MFTAQNSERILTIGQHLAKLQAKVVATFSGHGVFSCAFPCWNVFSDE